MLTKTELAQDAFEYIDSKLRTGDTYASHLINTKHRGKIFTFLPDELKNNPVDFEKSIFLMTKIRVYDESRDVVCKFVASFLDMENRVSLIETLSSRESVKKKPEPPSANYYQDEVYFFLKPHEKTDKVLRAFKGARDYPFICGLIDLNGVDFVLLEDQNIQTEWWSLLAEKTQYIIIGAFDNEGFLICEIER